MMGHSAGSRVKTALLVAGLLGGCGGGPRGAGTPDHADAGSASASDWTFVLVQPSGAEGSRWALEKDSGGQPGWVTVRGPAPSTSRIWLRERCEIPDCGVDPAVCGMSLPVVRTLSPGDSLSWRWDGRTSRTRMEGTCEIRQPAAPGRYTVEVCSTREAPQPGDTPADAPHFTGLECSARQVEVPGSGRLVWDG